MLGFSKDFFSNELKLYNIVLKECTLSFFLDYNKGNAYIKIRIELGII